jgi:hypothetical protein
MPPPAGSRDHISTEGTTEMTRFGRRGVAVAALLTALLPGAASAGTPVAGERPTQVVTSVHLTADGSPAATSNGGVQPNSTCWGYICGDE